MKSILLLSISSLILIMSFAMPAFASKKLIVGATEVPHAEVLRFIQPILAQKGVDLEIRIFNDYVTPNIALEQGDIDAHYLIHLPHLKAVKEADKQFKDLIPLGAGIHVEPIPAFSYVYSSIDEIKDNSTFAIPNTPSDEGRALQLLQSKGYIKLKNPTNILSTIKDITENPKNFKFKELEAPQIPRVVMNKDVDIAIVNGNFALQAGLDFNKVLFKEGSESPYANVVVIKESRKNDDAIKILDEVIHSPEVRDFINKKYNGAAIAAF